MVRGSPCICMRHTAQPLAAAAASAPGSRNARTSLMSPAPAALAARMTSALLVSTRSEEHTSELQSLRHLVCRLLLEKKKAHSTKNQVEEVILVIKSNKACHGELSATLNNQHTLSCSVEGRQLGWTTLYSHRQMRSTS